MTIRLAVGIPAYGGKVAAGQAKMWMQFGAELAKLRAAVTFHSAVPVELTMIATVDVCGVERARNLLVANAMEQSAHWLLMIDADTWVEPGQDLVRMVRDADREEAAVVGAAVQTRGGNCLNVYRWNQEARKHEPVDRYDLQKTARPLQEVDAIGGAVIAIDLRRIGNVDFRWLYREDGSSMSEDLYFCRRLRERGEKVLCDTHIETFHSDRPGVLHYKP